MFVNATFVKDTVVSLKQPNSSSHTLLEDTKIKFHFFFYP